MNVQSVDFSRGSDSLVNSKGSIISTKSEIIKKETLAHTLSVYEANKNILNEIDKEIIELEVQIKKLQGDIAKMTESANKPLKEYFSEDDYLNSKNEHFDISKVNISDDPEQESLDNLRRTFKMFWDDPDSPTTSGSPDISMINELREELNDKVFDKIFNSYTAQDFENDCVADMNRHALRKFLAKQVPEEKDAESSVGVISFKRDLNADTAPSVGDILFAPVINDTLKTSDDNKI